MSKEYIEREAVIKHKRMMQGFGFSQQDEYLAAAVLVEDIEKIPAADVVEVRHGRWIDKGWYGDSSWQIDGCGNCWRVHECSECKAQQKGEITSYCPHCGAKMDKKELKS